MRPFELEGGRVVRYREYFDTGAARVQFGFAPESLAKGRRQAHLRPCVPGAFDKVSGGSLS
jgi:hypothetical protein